VTESAAVATEALNIWGLGGRAIQPKIAAAARRHFEPIRNSENF